jgi:hypothetical protein
MAAAPPMTFFCCGPKKSWNCSSIKVTEEKLNRGIYMYGLSKPKSVRNVV